MAEPNQADAGSHSVSGGVSADRRIYLDLLRIIAIILVIFNHTDGCYLYYTVTENPLTYAYSLLGSVLCMTDVPLFFMITGALLIEREESTRQLLRHRVVRIAAALVFFSFIHYVVDVMRGQIAVFSVLDFLRGLAENTLVEQYWYLYAYIGILLLMPVLRSWAKGMRPEDYGYLLLLEAGMAVLLPLAYETAGLSMPSSLYVLSVYLFYLLIGHAIDKGAVQLPGQKGTWRTRTVLIGIPVCVAAAALVCIGLGSMRGYQRADLEYLTPILTVLLFAGIRRLCSIHVFTERACRVIKALGSCSFGIYLTEHLVRILLLPVYLYLTEHSVGVIACTVYVLGTYVIGLCLTLILKKIPGIRSLL